MLSDQDIFHRYLAKQTEFSKVAKISLLGHSLFDMWGDQPCGTPSLNGKSVANLGISGVSTRQYLDVIIKPKRIQHLGNTVLLFLGVNDIVKEADYSPQQVMEWLTEILNALKAINPNAHFYLLEATPVDQISTVTNAEIMQLNQYFAENRPLDLGYIPTQTVFADQNGNLKSTLHTDGLHFSAQGYTTLQQLLENYC